jgi:hypothetical protein
MPHVIQLSPTAWINADAITEIHVCTEQVDAPHFHIRMQGQDDDLELAPEEHRVFGMYLKAWSLSSV